MGGVEAPLLRVPPHQAGSSATVVRWPPPLNTSLGCRRVVQMHFFRTYRKWRVMASFNRFIRLRHMATAALKLVSRLHVMNPVLARPAAAVSKMMFYVRQEELVQDPQEPPHKEQPKPWLAYVLAC